MTATISAMLLMRSALCAVESYSEIETIPGTGLNTTSNFGCFALADPEARGAFSDCIGQGRPRDASGCDSRLPMLHAVESGLVSVLASAKPHPGCDQLPAWQWLRASVCRRTKRVARRPSLSRQRAAGSGDIALAEDAFLP